MAPSVSNRQTHNLVKSWRSSHAKRDHANSFFSPLSLSLSFIQIREHRRAALLTVCKLAHERGRRCVSLIYDACHAWRAHFRHSLSTVAPIHWPVVVKVGDRAVNHRVALRPRTGCLQAFPLALALSFQTLDQTKKVHKTGGVCGSLCSRKDKSWLLAVRNLFNDTCFLCRGGRNRFLLESVVFFLSFFFRFLVLIRLLIVYWKWLILFWFLIYIRFWEFF